MAGRDALGLRLAPAAPQSSIDHVDIWVDPETSIPLRVEVYAVGDPTASFTSEFMTFSDERPDADVTDFHAPPGADVSYDDVIDVADASNRYAPIAPPRRLAGLAQSSNPDLRAVGVYGRGVTQLIAIPLWDRAAEPLREQLEKTPGVKLIDEGDILQVGPLSVLLTRVPLRRRLADRRHRHPGHRDHRRTRARRQSAVRRPMIQTRQLTKRFGPILAVDRLDLDVREGDIYGFLGANGSGKTTTVRMLLGLVLATSGEVDLMGKRMPGAARSVLPSVGRAGRGPGGVRTPVGPGEPQHLRRDGTGR